MKNRNPIGWFEIYVDDIEKAKSFYQDVFQTELERVSPLGAEESGLEMWKFPQNFEMYGASGPLCQETCRLENQKIIHS